MTIKVYIGMALIIAAIIGKIVWDEIQFRHYDFREQERTGTTSRPGEKKDTQRMDADDIWIQNYVYDPETKSFKHIRDIEQDIKNHR